METVVLEVEGKQIRNFRSYLIEADLYCADHAFSLDLIDPETEITPGARCELFVSGELELTGIVDRIRERGDKSGRMLTVEGRDLMGLLVDSYCEEFFDVTGMTLKALAERLLKTVPFIQREDVTYQENVSGNLKRKTVNPALAVIDIGQAFTKIEPGKTVFEVLKTFAASKGMIFMGLADGTFEFGVPKQGGAPLFYLNRLKAGAGRQNNIIEGERIQDISRRYSKVVIIGQQQFSEQDQKLWGISATNIKADPTDPSFPFYKPYVAEDNQDARAPALHAKMLLERMRQQGFQLIYKTNGHSQNGQNFKINEFCHVEDDALPGANGDYLIYARRFEMSKERGVFTTLKLGLPGGTP